MAQKIGQGDTVRTLTELFNLLVAQKARRPPGFDLLYLIRCLRPPTGAPASPAIRIEFGFVDPLAVDLNSVAHNI